MCAQEHITFIPYESYGAFLAPYTLRLLLINKIQIQHVDVQRCTSRVHSGFRLWTKIFTTTLSRCYARACRRGGTTRVSNQEEMDVVKPTFSGSTGPVVAQTGPIPVTRRRLPNMRERERDRDRDRDRDRETEHAHNTDSTHTTCVQEATEKKCTQHRQRHECTQLHIHMYLQGRDTTPASSRSKQVRLQQWSAAKSPFGEFSDSSLERGLA
mgnify:CR=1 FL=1